MSYECYITNLLDDIIILQGMNCDDCDLIDSTTDNELTSVDYNALDSLHNQESVILSKLQDKSDIPYSKTTDINHPSTTKGYIAMQSTQFEFSGPDRATNISSVHQYLRISKVIRESRLLKYRQARILVKSGLNIEEWKRLSR